MTKKLEVSDLVFDYENRKILNYLDFSVNEGEFVSILGPSGCGKSTLLKLLTGVLKAEKGHILVDGQEIKGVTEHFAYMPQNDLLFSWKTILENVCLYGRIHGSADGMKEQAIKQMEAFGLKGYEDEYPSSLSGGMRQRAAFLRTLLCHSASLNFDIPKWVSCVILLFCFFFFFICLLNQLQGGFFVKTNVSHFFQKFSDLLRGQFCLDFFYHS